ncbi:uncharacterized protein LOC144146417 [Haemaphysalis longicornis]
MPQSSIAYNLKWGNTTKTTSFIRAQGMCAQFKKKVRSVLKKNKVLVRALVSARTELAYFKEVASRWDKNESLYLAMLQLWLEADLDHIRALFENHVRATTHVKGLLTPDANVTLTAADSLMIKSTTESPDEQQVSPHPPGSRYNGRDRDMSVVLEENEKYETDIMAPLHDLAETLQPEPEIGRFSRATFRKNSSRSGRRRSLLPEDPLLASIDPPSVAPAAAAYTSTARPLLTCPRARTPCRAAKEGARFHSWFEDSGSSRAAMRVHHRRLPSPVIPGAMAHGLSLPLNEGSPGVTESSLLSPPCVFDMGFMETPRPTRSSVRTPCHQRSWPSRQGRWPAFGSTITVHPRQKLDPGVQL